MLKASAMVGKLPAKSAFLDLVVKVWEKICQIIDKNQPATKGCEYNMAPYSMIDGEIIEGEIIFSSNSLTISFQFGSKLKTLQNNEADNV